MILFISNESSSSELKLLYSFLKVGGYCRGFPKGYSVGLHTPQVCFGCAGREDG